MAALAIASALALSLLAGIAPAHAATTPGSTYFALTPARILDTRVGTGAPVGPIGAGASIDLPVVDTKGVPAAGVTAVVLNVTATDATGPASFLTVYPAGTTRPLASNLNFTAGSTSANLVTVAVPTAGDHAGKVTIFNDLGSVNVVADINGWYSANGGALGATYHPLTPDRILDTRNGAGGVAGPVTPGQTIEVQVTGRGGVPETGVSAVVLNVTAVHQSGLESFFTVYPSGTDRPLASNVNLRRLRAVPNLVVARVGTNGRLSMYNDLGMVNVVADVQGWYTSTGTTTGATYFPVSPARVLDTRNPLGVTFGVGLGPEQSLSFHPIDLGTSGVRPTAVVLNVTAANHSGPDSFLTVYPDLAAEYPASDGRPLASNLNFVSGQTIPNLVFARVTATQVKVYNNAGGVHVVADVQGWFLANGG